MIEMRQLTDVELDVVCGGTLNIASPNIVTNTNTVTQVGVAIAGSGGLLGGGGNAVVGQISALTNTVGLLS
jgi:hypothetical protein